MTRFEDDKHRLREIEQINLILKEILVHLEKHGSSKDKNSKPPELRYKIDELNLVTKEIKNIINKDQLQDDLFDLSDKLRNPLVPIIAYTDMLILGKFGNLESSQLNKIKAVNNNAKLLQKRITDTLNTN